MKAIKIKVELKQHFLQAANHLGLSVNELKKTHVEGHVYFRVQGQISQDDIFKLGYLFYRITNK